MKKIIFLVLLCASTATFAQHTRLNIAVSDLAGQGVDESSTAIISDRLRTALFKEGGFTVLERNAMQDVLKEQGFQQSGCTSDACAVEIGQLLGVSYIVVGSVGKIGRLYTINVRVIEIRTGKVIYSESVDCDCPIEKVLTNSVVEIARKISQNVEGLSRKTSSSTDTQDSAAGGMPATKDSKADAEGRNAVKSTAQNSGKARRVVLKASLGGVAAAALATGIVYNTKIQKKMDEVENLKAIYDDNDAFQSAAKPYYDDARSFEVLRNICYGVAGAAVVGLGVSFFF